MGDNDTKNDAKKICFIEAKRLCVEKAGTYIESNTEVKNYKLTRDEINTYTAAILKVEIISEKTEFIGESIAIIMTVKAEIDANYIFEKIKQIKNNKKLENDIKYQQLQLKSLESKIRSMQKNLATKDVDKIIENRKKRKELFDKIDEIDKIKIEIRSKTKLAVENVELGMTPDEVIKVAGKPRSIVGNSPDLRYNYGNVWVVIESGVVSCLVKAKYFKKWMGRDNYQFYKPNAIIK